MSLPRSEADQREITRIATASAQSAMIAFDALGVEFSQEWESVRPEIVNAIQSGRAAAIDESDGYIAAAMADQGTPAGTPIASISRSGLLASAPDGRTIEGLIDQALIRTKTLVKGGSSPRDALASAREWVGRATIETVRETATDLRTLDMIRHPRVRGYVRQLALPACRWCVPLAGRFYAFNAGFQRHRGCDCVHVPVGSNSAADSLKTDPRAYWDSLTRKQQDDLVGIRTATAIRDGDMDLVRAFNVKNRTPKKRTFDGVTIDLDAETVEETRRRTLRMLRSDTSSGRPTVDDIVKAADGDRDRMTNWLTEAGYLDPIGFDYAGRSQRSLASASTRTRDITQTSQQTSAERRFASAWEKRHEDPEAWSRARASLSTATGNVRDLARVLGAL